jgi:H+/Cl- antiporter ClcA
MEQPNATGDGDVALSVRFWVAVVCTGVAAGLLGDAMMSLLFGIQHWAFGYQHGSFEAGVKASSGTRRVVVLVIAGAFGGLAWYVLRHLTAGEPSEIDEALWQGDAHLSFRRSLGTSVISEIVIGAGASLGREAAPKLLGGASGSQVATWMGLSAPQRRLLVACGGGAGLAAVYNVPLAGALFTAEILVATVTLPVILPALACSGVATATAWLTLPTHATYVGIPSYRVGGAIVVWSVLAGPVVGLAAAGYIRLVGWVSHRAVRGRVALAAPAVAFTVLGVIGIRYPQLFGNGKDMAHDAFVGTGSLALFAALAALKPIVTSLCLSSGASGGLLTPVMSTGAMMGGCLGILWSHLWAGSATGAYALVGAAAMVGAGMQAPLTALVLIVELTHSGFALMVPMVVATVGATAMSRTLDGYSIYSARLSARPDSGLPRAGS